MGTYKYYMKNVGAECNLYFEKSCYLIERIGKISFGGESSDDVSHTPDKNIVGRYSTVGLGIDFFNKRSPNI